MEGEYKHSIQKVHNKEYLIKNACYSVTKYYLCKQNNKRSLLGRKQRSQVVRSFPNRYQFSCTNKVTSLFSDRYIFIIILRCKTTAFTVQKNRFHNARQQVSQRADCEVAAQESRSGRMFTILRRYRFCSFINQLTL